MEVEYSNFYGKRVYVYFRQEKKIRLEKENRRKNLAPLIGLEGLLKKETDNLLYFEDVDFDSVTQTGMVIDEYRRVKECSIQKGDIDLIMPKE